MRLSIVVPCYNEEAVIQETNNRLYKLINRLSNKELIKGYEIIYVDDGSADSTLKILKQLASKDKNIKIISFSGNFGHQSALIAGLHNASGDIAVSLDADLQDPPEVIEKMLYKFKEGYEIVYGVRRVREKDTVFKKVTAHFFYKAMKLMGINLVYDHADFRLLSRRILSEFKKYTEANVFLRGIFPIMGFKQCIVEYERRERFAGETKYSLIKMLSFAIEGITSFSYFPLRISSIFGFTIFTISLLLMVWAFITKILGNAIPGWASTILPLYLFGGLQLMFLGIIGEYIGKIYMEVKKRPLFIVKEKVNFED